jgi:hypothetical protein
MCTFILIDQIIISHYECKCWNICPKNKRLQTWCQMLTFPYLVISRILLLLLEISCQIHIVTHPGFVVFTAYCRNPYDTQWYCFDDTRVDPVADTSLVTAAAYILFYQRRGLGTSYSSAASTSSSGSGGLEHWVCRMPAFTRSSKSQEELSHKGQFVLVWALSYCVVCGHDGCFIVLVILYSVCSCIYTCCHWGKQGAGIRKVKLQLF